MSTKQGSETMEMQLDVDWAHEEADETVVAKFINEHPGLSEQALKLLSTAPMNMD